MKAFWLGLPLWMRLLCIAAVFLIVYAGWMAAKYSSVKKRVVAMQNSLKAGDVVLTHSGLYGVLLSVEKTTAHLQLTNGFEVIIDRFSIKEPAAEPTSRAVKKLCKD